MSEGLHTDIDAAAYHNDPAPEPSLSSSIARVLLDRSAWHAWTAHPRLNSALDTSESDRKRRLQLGSAAHALLLGKGKAIEVIDADTFQSKAAREMRDDAAARGLIVVTRGDYRIAQDMARVARRDLPAIVGSDPFADGQAEVVAMWRDPLGPWCRVMIDWLRPDGIVYDYKTTALSAYPDPQTLGRRIADLGYDMQAAFYKRGLEVLKPELRGRLRFRFIFQETDEPYGLTVVELDGMAEEMGRRRAAAAISLWHRHLSAGIDIRHWPGYPPGIITIEYPAFLAAMQERREMMDSRYETLPHDPLSPVLHRPKQLMEPN
ncbi:MAG: PD-(D/E)XK nuclease-like domain-containing protein [Beijerinckiaceae bacterium]